MPCGQCKGCPHVLLSRSRRKADLSLRPLAPNERGRQEGPAAQPCQMPRQFRRLIEATLKKSARMQRHGQNGIAITQMMRAGADHPARHHRGKIGAIPVFQCLHQLSGRSLVDHRRTQPVEGRRIGNRLRRQHAVTRIIGKWQSQHFAERTFDKGNRRPAAGTKPRMTAGHDTTAHADRRIDEIGHPPRPPGTGRFQHAQR